MIKVGIYKDIDFDRLDILDEEYQTAVDEARLTYERTELPKVMESLSLMKKDVGEEEIRSMKIQSLKEEISGLQRIIDGIYARYEERYRQGISVEHRQILLYISDIDKLEKRLKKLKNTLIILESYEQWKDGEITPEQVLRAKEYPLSNLVELDIRGFCKCPFHKDKTPSMSYWKDKNILHCFGCGVSKDSIQFVIDMYNKTFSEAVKYLNSL
jgi:hypothetical protein